MELTRNQKYPRINFAASAVQHLETLIDLATTPDLAFALGTKPAAKRAMIIAMVNWAKDRTLPEGLPALQAEQAMCDAAVAHWPSPLETLTAVSLDPASLQAVQASIKETMNAGAILEMGATGSMRYHVTRQILCAAQRVCVIEVCNAAIPRAPKAQDVLSPKASGFHFFDVDTSQDERRAILDAAMRPVDIPRLSAPVTCLTHWLDRLNETAVACFLNRETQPQERNQT